MLFKKSRSWVCLDIDLLNLVAFKSSTFEFYHVPTSSCWKPMTASQQLQPTERLGKQHPLFGAGTDKGNWADLLGNSVVSSGFFQQKCTCNEGASNSSSCTILHAGSVLSRSLRQHLLNPYLPNFMAGQPTPPLTYPEIASLRIRAYENIWKPLVSLK